LLRKVRDAGDTLDLLRFVYALLLVIAFGAEGAESVGSQACASCHAATYRSFMRTQMAQRSGRVGTQEPKERFDRAEFRDSSGVFVYTVGRDGSGYYFDFRKRVSKQTQQVLRKALEFNPTFQPARIS